MMGGLQKLIKQQRVSRLFRKSQKFDKASNVDKGAKDEWKIQAEKSAKILISWHKSSPDTVGFNRFARRVRQ